MKEITINKKLLVRVLLVCLVLYVLSWAAFWLNYLGAKRSLDAKYGVTTKVEECTGGATNGRVLVDSNRFELDWSRARSMNVYIPILMHPIMSFDDYRFTYYYKNGSETRTAVGRTNGLGNVREEYNQKWEYGCLLN